MVNRAMVCCVVVMLLVMLAVPSGAAELPPNVSLQVTVRQKEEGKLGKGLHLVQLLCWQGSCSLTWLSLNQCGTAGSGKQAFFPKIERFATGEGNLLHVISWENKIEVKVTEPDILTTLVFGYEKNFRHLLSTKVTSFSGGYVKHSSILEKVLTVEYIPLEGAFSEIPLDCAVLLPGLQRRK
jgi:hypothetical protein